MKKQILKGIVSGISIISAIVVLNSCHDKTDMIRAEELETTSGNQIETTSGNQIETTSDNQIETTAGKVIETTIEIEKPLIKIVGDDNKAKITWRKQSGISGYEVYARQYKKKNYKRVSVTNDDVFRLKELKPGCFYKVKVCGFVSGNGAVRRGKFSKPIKVVTNVKLVSAKSLQTATLNISWERSKKIDGYEICYSKKQDFSKAKKVRIANKQADMTNLYELVQDKTYYVKIRTYKVIKKKKYYSVWSKAKKCKIKNADSVINGNFKETDGFFKDSVFFGDSVMLGFGNYIRNKEKGYLDGAKMMGVGSYNLIHALSEESDLHPLYRGKHVAPHKVVKELGAKKVFLFFGINDVLNVGGLDAAYTHYIEFIKKMKKYNPEVEIYIISDTYTLKGSKFYVEFRKRLHKLNKLMREYCAKNGYEFIDIASYLADKRGYLKKEYCSDGFLHQTYEAYVIWDKVLRNYAYTKR
ncbi:MAG: hypothetical protein E7254_04470 [Lachnospiraceae bacterium]|nr:hypothetical protein [Lachnospiraceae bacterium]